MLVAVVVALVLALGTCIAAMESCSFAFQQCYSGR
jgi:hypothetical protein